MHLGAEGDSSTLILTRAYTRAAGFCARHRQALVALGLFLGLVLVYNANGRFIAGSDVYCTRFMPVNLALNGHEYFDPAKPYYLGTVVSDLASPSHGRMISPYPTYTPTLLLPLYLPLYRWLGVPPEHYLTFYLDKLLASLFVAGAALLTFSLVRRMHGGRNRMALLTTLAVALGTSLWAVASQGSWSHGPSAFYLILAVWALERAVRQQAAHPRRVLGWAFWAGWAAASAFVTRQTDIFFTLPFFFFALWELRRSRWALAGLLAGVLPVAGWFVAHNLAYFGDMLTTGYKYNMAQQRIPRLMHPENFFAGFFGLLFSPSLGMFTMGPVTLFAIPGIVSLLKRRRRVLMVHGDGSRVVHVERSCFMQRLLRLCIVFIALHVLFYSCYLEWWGGWSYCYRYLIDIQPFLALCIGWHFRPQARWPHLRWPLFVPALALSVAVQFYGAFFWCGGNYFSQVKTERLYLDLSPAKGHGGLFDKPSIHFSLAPQDHLILSELKFVRWDVGSWAGFWRPFTTPEKIERDLFQTRTVSFRPSPPIVLEHGQVPPVREARVR